MAPKYDASLDSYLKEYQANPRSRVFAPLAEAYRKSGLVDEAIDICKEGLEYHPNFISGMVALSRCYFDKGQYTATIKELEKVVSEAPDNFLAQKLLAESYSLVGSAQNALKAYKMVLFLNPRDADAKKIVSDMESTPSSKPSEETIARILGEDEKIKKEEEVFFPPLPPLLQKAPPQFELKKETVDNLLSEYELGFEEKPAYQVFNIIGEEEQEKILTDIGTSTMGDLLEKQGHKQKALEVYKRIYDKTLDERVKEKIKALEASLGIKGYEQETPKEEDFPKESYFQHEVSEEKDAEPKIMVYKPEAYEDDVADVLVEGQEAFIEPVLLETKQDEQWIPTTPVTPEKQEDLRLKMLKELLDGFQKYKKIATEQ